MMKYYKHMTGFYIDNDKQPFYTYCNYEMLDQVPKTEIIKINWDNVLKFCENDILPFGIRKTRKGLRLYFSDYYRTIKQWKENLNIEIKTTYEECTPSIKKIINYHDGDKAIQYLVERGLNIANLK